MNIARMDGGDQPKTDVQTTVAAMVATMFLLVFWWAFYSMGFSSGRYEERAHIQREHYAADSAERLGKDCGRFTGSDFHKCAYQVVKTEHESQRAESDLAAQWEAADWVRWALVISILQAIATIVGLIFVKGTLDATRKAVEDTTKATGAMERQNELTEQAFRQASVTSRAQLRTYLSSESETYTPGETGTNPEIGYIYRNVGLTPAHDVIFTLIVIFQQLKNAPTSTPHRRMVSQTIIPYGVIGPGAKNSVAGPLDLDAQEVAAINAEHGLLAVFVTIAYRDEFGDHWLFRQNMVANKDSAERGLLYTTTCATEKKEAQETEGELALVGGKDGRTG